MATVAVGFVVATAVTVAAVALGAELARCYVGVFPLPDQPICGSGVWGHEAVPVVLLTLTVGIGLASAWLTGLAVHDQFMGAHALAHRLLVRAVPPPVELRSAARAVGLDRVVYVVQGPPTAITLGVVRPRVVVSESLVRLLTPVELEAVLAHEREHQRRRHPAIFGLSRTIARANFFMPALTHTAHRIVLVAETAADAAAVDRYGVRPLVAALQKLSMETPEPDIAIGSVRGMLDERVLVLAGCPSDAGAAPPRVKLASLAGLLAVATPAVVVLIAYLRVRGALV